MRRLKHLTPRYIVNRIKWELWMRSHPNTPWLTPNAVAFLQEWLQPDDIGIEWGSGRSTMWLAGKTASVLSVEHDEKWYREVKTSFEKNNVTNVDYRHVPLGDTDYSAQGSPDHPYVAAGRDVDESSADYVLVDGSMRGYCMKLAMTRLRPDGVLILDNAHFYFPHETRAPYSVGANGRPKSELWKELWEELQNWRIYWTTCGCQDTALFFRP